MRGPLGLWLRGLEAGERRLSRLRVRVLDGAFEIVYAFLMALLPNITAFNGRYLRSGHKYGSGNG